MRVGEALRRGILVGSLVASTASCSGIDVPHGEDGRAHGAHGGSTPIGGAGGGAATSSTGGTGGTSGTSGTGGTNGGAGGTAGTNGTSGTAGSGIIIPIEKCPDCPSAGYGVTVHGDGSDLVLLFNAPTDLEPMCPSQPVLGYVGGGCAGTRIYLHTCEAPDGDGACLELTGATAVYTDRDGRVWTGTVTALGGSDQFTGTDTGTLTLELEAGGDALELTVDYLTCTAGFLLRIVC